MGQCLVYNITNELFQTTYFMNTTRVRIAGINISYRLPDLLLPALNKYTKLQIYTDKNYSQNFPKIDFGDLQVSYCDY